MKNNNIESLPKEDTIPKKLDNSSVLKSLEIYKKSQRCYIARNKAFHG